eukprot:655531-Pelagomonas_calceolata.AAC.12
MDARAPLLSSSKSEAHHGNAVVQLGGRSGCRRMRREGSCPREWGSHDDNFVLRVGGGRLGARERMEGLGVHG